MKYPRELRILRELEEVTKRIAHREDELAEIATHLVEDFQYVKTLAARLEDARQAVPWPDLPQDEMAVLTAINEFDDDFMFTKSDFPDAVRGMAEQKFRKILGRFLEFGYIDKNPQGPSKWGFYKGKMPNEPIPAKRGG